MKLLRRLFVLALIVGGFALYRMASPYQGFEGETYVTIPHGASTNAIAGLLASSGVVRSKWDFLAARTLERGRVLKAGEYRFHREATPLEVYDRIARGDTFYLELVIPEGRNLFEIGTAAEHLGLFSAAEFERAAQDPELIRDLDPKAPSLEGYLFPDTYHLARHTKPQQLCRIMTAKFREVWSGLKTDANVHDTVTLASLVEKEGKLAGERPLIAAVFRNRLRLGMKLDCDPTTIYAALLSGRYNGVIHRSDLDSTHPYNTYQHAGLPPGPIANPGVASIKAALDPAQSQALYFVAKPDGSGAHEFNESLAAHTEAAARYRHGRTQ